MKNWQAVVPVAAALVFAAACADAPEITSPSLRGRADLVDPLASITGSIKTTLPTCVVVNGNVQYTSKQDVYVNGGEGALGPLAPAGDYYVRVTSPMGTILGKSDGAVYTVVGDASNPCEQVWALVYQTNAAGSFLLNGAAKIQGYVDTDNSGNEYQLEVCADAAFTPSRCKYDNFKVRQAGGGGGGGNPEEGFLAVQKFYDADGNGVMNGSEILIPWKFTVDGTPIATTSILLTWLSSAYTAPTYATVVEALGGSGPVPGGATGSTYSWSATTPTTVVAAITMGVTNLAEFGNRCSVTTGMGHTLGWYANNGNSSITTDQLTYLVTNFYLVYGTKDGKGKNGVRVTSFTRSTFATWLLNANSGNGANMLSAQLATAWLNIQNNFSDGDVIVDGARTLSQELVYASNLIQADPFGTINKAELTRVQALIAGINTNTAGPFVQPVLNTDLCPLP